MKKINILKQNKHMFILSDGTCFSEFRVSSQQRNNRFILSNQDLNNTCFWVESTKKQKFNNEFELLDSSSIKIS